MTDDEHIFYPLAAESEEDMEDWISLLNSAIRMEVEETDAGTCYYVGTVLLCGLHAIMWVCAIMWVACCFVGAVCSEVHSLKFDLHTSTHTYIQVWAH